VEAGEAVAEAGWAEAGDGDARVEAAHGNGSGRIHVLLLSSLHHIIKSSDLANTSCCCSHSVTLDYSVFFSFFFCSGS
jgi:hypothetical protein